MSDVIVEFVEQCIKKTSKYLMLNGGILMARYDDKKGAWNITIRRPHPKEVEFYMSKGEWTID